MLSFRRVAACLGRRGVPLAPINRLLSSTPSTTDAPEEPVLDLATATAEDVFNEIEERKNAAQRKVEAMVKLDPTMVLGTVLEERKPKLPDNPAEISALDPADHIDIIQPDTGERRLVHIHQRAACPNQNPTHQEQYWHISFLTEGAGKNWENPLMGWKSGSDPMASNIQTQFFFENAQQAVDFCKKRGWTFTVDAPIIRVPRQDGAQYQDNFLPQDIATKVRMEKKNCDEWHRPASGASHYVRPLTYHGGGITRQHGPNRDAPEAEHVEGLYKKR
mmetsp:Transcript_28768/g.44182  ORF Transcript_28768/g.44182 Transcript_28768/m.44182 type:complete len:276 (+) Transcript_28768:43-870(+)